MPKADEPNDKAFQGLDARLDAFEARKAAEKATDAAWMAEKAAQIEISKGSGGFAWTAAKDVGEGAAVMLTNVKIDASADGGHGVMATGGGTVTLTDVDINTTSSHSSAIATDRGGGTITVTRTDR